MTPQERIREALTGVVAVLVAPYADGTVDQARTDALATRVDAAGIHALTSLGNTAELFQLTPAEQRAHREAVAARPRTAVLIAGVAGAAKSVTDDIGHARELGYDAAMLHEPADPFGDEEGLIAYYTAVAEASPLPVVAYLRTRRLHASGLRALADLPNVIGVKYARSDLDTLSQVLQEGAGASCTWVNGSAESRVLSFAERGVFGFTSGIANVRPDMAQALNTALRAGDPVAAERLLPPMIAVERIRGQGHGKYNVAVLKALLAHSGFDAGGVRAPHAELPAELRARLLEGFEDWPLDPASLCSRTLTEGARVK